jgi:hypothetical protein
LGNKSGEVHKWVFVLTSLIITAPIWTYREPLQFVGVTFLESTTVSDRQLTSFVISCKEFSQQLLTTSSITGVSDLSWSHSPEYVFLYISLEDESSSGFKNIRFFQNMDGKQIPETQEY